MTNESNEPGGLQAAGAILAGIVSACGTTTTTRTTPVPATSAHTTVPVTGSATPTTPTPAPAPAPAQTVGPGQSASIVMKVTSDVGTTPGTTA
jgi:hypothetical protein